MSRIAYCSISLGMMIFPATVLTFNALKDVSIALILLGALSLLWVSRGQWSQVSSEVKMVAIAFCLFAAWSVFSVFVVGDYSEEGKVRLSKHIAFIYVLFIIPAYSYIKGIGSGVLILGFTLGCIAVFSYGVYQYHVPGDFGRRAYGDTHPNRYGGISMSMAVLMLSYAVFYKTKRLLRVLMLVVAVLGIGASFYSFTRGSWIALPPIALLIGGLYIKKKQRWKEAVMGVLLMLMVVTGGGYLLGAKNHVERTYKSTMMYFDGRSSTSLGLRFEMFRSAVHLAVKSPVTGVGVGRYKTELDKLVDESKDTLGINPKVKYYDNPHNEYFLALAERGVVGLILFLGVLLLPSYAFYKQYIVTHSAASVAGLCIVLCYSIVGLSIGLFLHSAFTQFYLVAVLALLMSKETLEGLAAREAS